MKKTTEDPCVFKKRVNRDIYLSVFSVLSILIGIFGFGYGWTENKYGFTDDFSVSYAIGNGEKPAITAFIVIGTLLALVLIGLRKGAFMITRLIFVILIAALLIALMYINPLIIGEFPEDTDKVNQEHGALAIAAFTSALIFNILTYVAIGKYNGGSKALVWTLGVLNVIFYLLMYVIVYILSVNIENYFNSRSQMEEREFGAAVEIIQILFFLTAVILTGVL